MGISLQALAGLVDLVLGFEQKRLEATFGKAAVEIEEGAMFGAFGVAVTIGFAAFEGALKQGSTEEMRCELKGAQEMGFALAKGQGGSAAEMEFPTYIYM